jgi:hypothetical protein
MEALQPASTMINSRCFTNTAFFTDKTDYFSHVISI